MIKEKLEKITADKNLLQKILENNKNRKENFNLGKMTENYLDLYESFPTSKN